MSLQSRLASLISAIGADIKALNAKAITRVSQLPVTGNYHDRLIALDCGNGVMWLLKYNALYTQHRWEFLGGSPLIFSQTTAFQAALGGAWQAVAGLTNMYLPGMDQPANNLGGAYQLTMKAQLASSNEAWRPSSVLAVVRGPGAVQRSFHRIWYPMPPPVSQWNDMAGPDILLTITPTGGEATYLQTMLTAGDIGGVATFWSQLMQLSVVPRYLRAT